jgi:hypothetical protein
VFTDAVGFMSKVAPLPRRDLGASVIFRIPGLRELCLWLGVVDAGAATAHKVLSQASSDYAAESRGAAFKNKQLATAPRQDAQVPNRLKAES